MKLKILISLLILLLNINFAYAGEIRYYNVFYPKNCEIINSHVEYGYGLTAIEMLCKDKTTGRIKGYNTSLSVRAISVMEYIPTDTSIMYVKEVK